MMAWVSYSQTTNGPEPRRETFCDQPLQLKNELIDRVEPLKYTIRRIEFLGNLYTRDKMLRKYLLFAEGDIFMRKHFAGSIERLSRLEGFSPITIENVALRAVERSKDVDLVFCLKERPK
jgi:outer membrane protein assembly factor BamA